MSTWRRLALFAGVLVAVFAVALGVAAVTVPDSAVDSWQQRARDSHQEMSGGHDSGDDHAAAYNGAPAEILDGTVLSRDGYTLGPVRAPSTVDRPGELRFTITTAGGEPVRDYVRTHDKDLHLIVVRSDGSHFRHVHPVFDASSGEWALPWRWEAAGSYRVFADFTPDTGSGVVLARTVDVARPVTPVPVSPRTADHVDGFDVTLTGVPAVGHDTRLAITVTRAGAPVTGLQPYLGAFGHLVALREGDLAYLHVHPEGAEPQVGQTSGPCVDFNTRAPSAGRYLLYFDFQVDGVVRTATFVTDAGVD